MAPNLNKLISPVMLVALALCLASLPLQAHAEATGGALPTATSDVRPPPRYGMSVEYVNTYDPGHDIGFVLVTGFAHYDYGTLWNQDRPRELRFKVEAAAGGTVRPDIRTVASVGMLALYYLDVLGARELRPYVEAGVGLIYTDFKVQGQGLRFNFNPQLGIGAETPREDGRNLFASLRLHHFSNAELNQENRGVNSVVLQIGRYF